MNVVGIGNNVLDFMLYNGVNFLEFGGYLIVGHIGRNKFFLR